MKVKELIKVTNAEILGNLSDEISGKEIRISTDTRTIQEGDFYLPLKGASFDGEKFIEQALEKGAIGSFYTKELSLHQGEMAQSANQHASAPSQGEVVQCVNQPTSAPSQGKMVQSVNQPTSAPFQGEVAQSAKGGKKHRVLPYLTTFARAMRKEMTPQECKLWQYIRKEQLGVKFRRQHPISNKYIADFACIEKKLVIEVDGSQHVNNNNDIERTIYITNNGYLVIRFYNNEVDKNIEGCVEYLKQIIEETPPTGFADSPLDKGETGFNVRLSATSQGEVAQSVNQPTSAPFQGEVAQSAKGGILIKVPDTLTAYLQLANYRRNKINPTVVAVTGSSGKTTTKELIASVLGEKYKTFKTPLNHNNEIGFCQTIFEMPDDTECLVLEMGMRGLGEIELLSRYAEPDISIICNVGTAHIGRLGSRENIAKAKCEIVSHQRGGKWGSCFIAHDDKLIRKTVEFDGEKIFYSLNDVNVIEKNANYSKFEYQGNIYELNVGGDYNIENALSAINTGMKLELSVNEIQKGLKKYHPIEKRWEGVNVNGFEVINDSYNANPESMRAFVDTIFDLYDNYTLVLGDMGELGENETQYHKELGQYINNHKKLNPNTTVITIGTLSKNISDGIENCKSIHFEDIPQAVEFIKQNISKESKIFLKASRSMKFERIIEELK